MIDFFYFSTIVKNALSKCKRGKPNETNAFYILLPWCFPHGFLHHSSAKDILVFLAFAFLGIRVVFFGRYDGA